MNPSEIAPLVVRLLGLLFLGWITGFFMGRRKRKGLFRLPLLADFLDAAMERGEDLNTVYTRLRTDVENENQELMEKLRKMDEATRKQGHHSMTAKELVQIVLVPFVISFATTLILRRFLCP